MNRLGLPKLQRGRVARISFSTPSFALLLLFKIASAET